MGNYMYSIGIVRVCER